MSFKETELTAEIVSYVKSPIINGLRNLIHNANELHVTHGNNTMSDAVEKFLLTCLDSLAHCQHPAHKKQEEVIHPDENKEPKKTAGKKPAKVLQEKEALQDPAPEGDDYSDLFDSREEAIEALGLPVDKEGASKLKATDLVRIMYGVGNEDPLAYLGLAEKAAHQDKKKKELLTLIYGE